MVLRSLSRAPTAELPHPGDAFGGRRPALVGLDMLPPDGVELPLVPGAGGGVVGAEVFVEPPPHAATSRLASATAGNSSRLLILSSLPEEIPHGKSP